MPLHGPSSLLLMLSIFYERIERSNKIEKEDIKRGLRNPAALGALLNGGRMQKVFTIEEIRKVFWETFHASGEIFFSYFGDEKEKEASTNEIWKEFLENMHNFKMQKQ